MSIQDEDPFLKKKKDNNYIKDEKKKPSESNCHFVVLKKKVTRNLSS